jgi:hypothetical protein
MMFVHPSPLTNNRQNQQNSPQEICCTGTRFQNGKITTNRKKLLFNCTPGSACDRREGSPHSPEPEKIKRSIYTIYHIRIHPDPAYHFAADADPDPAYHFDADPDPGPTFQFFCAYPCGSRSTTLAMKMKRVHLQQTRISGQMEFITVKVNSFSTPKTVKDV